MREPPVFPHTHYCESVYQSTVNCLLPEGEGWNYWLATNFIHVFIHVAHSHHKILPCYHIDFLLILDYYPECTCSLVV